jgi:hypothetical protein
MDSAFANAGQPHGAFFDDAPKAYHITDAAMLRAAYGPASVPIVDPSDEDYTWDVQAPTVRLNFLPVDVRLAALEHQVKDLQRDVHRLKTLVHQLLNVGEEPDAA